MVGCERGPGQDLVALEAQLDACFETPVACLSAPEVSARLAALTRVTAKLDSLRTETVRAGDVIDVGSSSDQRNTANHVAALTKCDPADVRADSRLGEWLTDFALFGDAFRDGRLTAAHLNKLRLADNDRVHVQLIAAQQRFIGWFTACHFRDIDQLIERWLLGADPDGAAPDEHSQHVGLSLTPMPGGLTRLRGILDPLQASALGRALATETRRLRSKEDQAGETSRTSRRRLVALLNLVGRGTARPDGSQARPRVNIVMSQRVYEETLAWLADPTNPLPEPDHTDVDRKCQLIDGTPIHPLYAIAATATATFRRLVYDARGRPVEASYDSRQIPDWMRDATLIATNGKCSNPVCDAPFDWLHADHITPYSHDQTTSLEDTRPLCEPDNLWRGNDTNRGRWDAA